jgi:hypothetical protein
MATEIPMGGPSPEVLAQATDAPVIAGYHRPYVGAALQPEVDEADMAPPGTPVVGPTDGPFEEGSRPVGASIPLTAEQAAYLNAKYPTE